MLAFAQPAFGSRAAAAEAAAAPQKLRVDALVRPQRAVQQADDWLATDDPAQKRERLRWIASAAHRSGDAPALSRYIAQLDALAEVRGDALAGMHADFLRAESAFLAAQREDGLATSLRAAARVQDDRTPATRFEVSLQLCDDYATAGEPRNAAAHCGELLALAAQREDPLDRGQAFNIAGLAEMEAGNAPAAAALFERARAAVAGLADGEVARLFGDNLAEALLQLGRADEALELSRAALADELRDGRRGHASLSQANIARALHQLGRSDEALHEIDVALRQAGDQLLPLDLLELLATQAGIARAVGRHELAYASQSRMIELLRQPRDSQRERLLAEREADFASREAQLQLEELEHQAQRRSLELDSAQLRAGRQQQQLLGVAAFALGLGLVAVLLVLRMRAQRRHAERLAKQQRLTEDALATVHAQRAQVEALSAARTTFFANVSHELRTPLTLISAPLQDAQRGAVLTPATIASMQRNASRLERLVTQLLDLERLDAGRFPLHPQAGDLRDWIDETVETFAQAAAREGITLTWSRPDTLLLLRADPENIARVLSNMVSNALKFTPRGGRVAIDAWDTTSGIEVQVDDSGPGIPIDWRERVFDRFAQIGGKATRSREGAGLGLALCREIVRRHGGELSAGESALGGARLRMWLPRELHDGDADANLPLVVAATQATQSPEGGARPAHVPRSNDTRRRRVLVAEDNDELRAYIVGVLADEFEVIAAEDGEAALAHVRAELPDLVVSDVAMPRLDGFGLASAMREDALTAGIPLVFLTARAGRNDELEGLARGGDRYLRKPFESELLRAHVRSALHGVERLRRAFAAESAKTPPAAASPQPRTASSTRAHAEDAELARRVRAWFDARLHEEGLEIDELAAVLAISRPTLNRHVQSAFGLAPAALLRQLRLERARSLLQARHGTVSEIAYAVGYGSLSSFGRAYRDHFGHPPTLADSRDESPAQA